MDSLARMWSVKKLIGRCTRRPADEVAWREFVRRFHMAIQASVSNVLNRLKENDRANLDSGEKLIDELVNAVYRRLVENKCAALRLVKCTTTNSMNGYLLLVSIKVVGDYFRHRNAYESCGSARQPEKLEGVKWQIKIPAEYRSGAQSACR